MSEDRPALERPRVIWTQFRTKGTHKRANHQKAKNQARLLNALMSEDGDFDKALQKVDLTAETLRNYLHEDTFQNVLTRIAPYISAKVLVNILKIAEGEFAGAKDVHLKANLELLREFSSRATNGEFTFDSGVRKVRAEGEEERTNIGFKDMVRALARDEFVDYSEEIRKIRDDEVSDDRDVLEAGNVAEATSIIEDWEDEI